MRRFRLTIAACALLLGGPPSFASDPATCGTVIVPVGVGSGDPTPVTTLDPPLWTNSLYERQLTQLLYRPLVFANAAHEIDWDQSIAQSIEVRDGGATYRVTLKPWTWSDGVAVTADDVIYDWEMIQQLGATYYGYRTGGIPQLIASIKALDPRTIEFRLTQKVNPDWFELSGIEQFIPIPRHVWGSVPLARQQSLQSEASFYRVSDGPFLLSEFRLGRYAAFVPNPLYPGHKPDIRRLVTNFLQGMNPLAALAGGDVDIANLPFPLFGKENALGALQRVEIGPNSNTYTIIPNLKSSTARFLSDVRVRQAISMGIDQKQIMQVVYHGQSLLQRGFVPTALKQFLPPDLRDGHTKLDFDPARAAALLAQAGYAPGPDGIRTGHGERLAFTVFVTAGLEERLMTLQLVQSDLRRIGIAMSIKEMEFNQLIAKLIGPPSGWEAVYLGWTTESFPDGSQFFLSTSEGNYSHYASPTMDRLLERSITEPGTDALFALEHYVVDQQPMIFLPGGFYVVLARPGLGGLHQFVTPNGADWKPEYITLSGAMKCDDPHDH